MKPIEKQKDGTYPAAFYLPGFASLSQRSCTILGIFLFFLSTSIIHAQQFLNGSFEATKEGCRFTMSNGGFNSRIPQVRSIGNNEFMGGPNVLTTECAEPAADGDYYIGLSISGSHRILDIISLELSRPLVVGQTYTISYQHKRGNRGSLNNWLQIGLAETNELDDFGQLLYERKGTEKEWTKAVFQFMAESPGRFITLKLKIGTGARIHLDNFVMQCPTELELGNDTLYCVVQNVLLQPTGNFETYEWQDGSTTPTYTVNEPGRYLLTASRDDCVLQDSILIEEIEYNCDCQFYAPNAFSPNLDGRNDTFLPVTPCELVYYELRIFGRWGQVIYQSNDPVEGWDAAVGYDYYPAGEYVYLLRYQFTYQEEVEHESGSFLLMR